MTQNEAAHQGPQTPSVYHKEHNKWIFIGGAVLVVVLAIVAVAVYRQHHRSAEAESKAQELQTKMVAAGYPLPDKDTIIALLGSSGGAVCKDPTGSLAKAQWLDNMANGAGGPGMRPVIADHKAVAAEAIVISVYCPDRLEKFQQDLNNLKTGTTVRR